MGKGRLIERRSIGVTVEIYSQGRTPWPIQKLSICSRYALGALTGAMVILRWNMAAYGQYAQPAPLMAPQSVETAIVESATGVLNEIMAVPAQSIPRALLHDAQAIIIGARGCSKGVS